MGHTAPPKRRAKVNRQRTRNATAKYPGRKSGGIGRACGEEIAHFRAQQPSATLRPGGYPGETAAIPGGKGALKARKSFLSLPPDEAG